LIELFVGIPRGGRTTSHGDVAGLTSPATSGENLLASARSILSLQCALHRPRTAPGISRAIGTFPSMIGARPVAEEALMAARSFSGDAMRHAARIARLDLAGREDMLGPVVEGVYALIDRLDEVPLGETPPAIGFDPRWEA
jgi:hypothetical protein